MLYRRKPDVVEAIQYTGSKKSFDAIWDWTGGDGGVNQGYSGEEDDPRDFTIKSGWGVFTVRPGDWVVKEDDDFLAVDRDGFFKEYEECAE